MHQFLLLTVQEPFASAIMTLGKDVENRGSKPPNAVFRGFVGIHAGLGLTYLRAIRENLSEYTAHPVQRVLVPIATRPDWDRLPSRGQVLGSVLQVGLLAPDGKVAHAQPGWLEYVKAARDRGWWIAGQWGNVYANPVVTSADSGMVRGFPGYFAPSPALLGRLLEDRHRAARRRP